MNSPELSKVKDIFINSKDEILQSWVSHDSPKEILLKHDIELEYFIQGYGVGVFNYFMDVISEKKEIGNCPVIQELMLYLKLHAISVDELFEICNHFRISMVDFTYDKNINSKEIFDELFFIFNQNFRMVLKLYTDEIFSKLIDAKAEALKASQAREYFLSNMSHEVRTPLNAILGFVDILMDEDLSKKQMNYLNTISSSGESLLRIINDILDFSKLRSGKFIIEPKLFSIDEELNHTMELFVASANCKNITIVGFIDPMIPQELYADIIRIKQIISNFLSNAIKFTPNCGIIKVEAKYKNEALIISVKDNGIGLSQNDQIKIFSAFAQAQNNHNSGGTGLGLSISKQLAKHMSGKVYLDSKENVGSTFYLDVPVEVKDFTINKRKKIEGMANLKVAFYLTNEKNRYKLESFSKHLSIFDIDLILVESLDVEYDIVVFIDEDLKDMKVKKYIFNNDKKYISLMSKQNDEYENYNHIISMTFPLYYEKIKNGFLELFHVDTKQKINLNPKKKYQGNILVAEDNEANQELIKIILSKYGLSFDIVDNGLEAYKHFKANNYDLILMDEQMPIMSGNKAVLKILEYEINNALKHTPVSSFTANVVNNEKKRGLQNIYDSFLGKPIILKELEKIFDLYLKENKSVKKERYTEINNKKIVGLNIDKLMKELLLSRDEIGMLVELYIKKMAQQLDKLKSAIKIKDYKKIFLIAHSIKGSSANFRIEVIENKANEIETMAKNGSSDYDYNAEYKNLFSYIQKIKII